MRSKSAIVQARWAREDREIDRWISGPADQKAIDTALWLSEAILENPRLTNWLINERGANMSPLQKAAGLSLDVAGGWLVPSLVADQIIEYRALSGVTRQFASTWTIRGGDELAIPRRASGITAAFLTENTAISESSLTFDSLTLTPRKAGAYVRLSQEVAQDAAADFANYIVEEVAAALALLEDQCTFAGDGSATYSGMSGIASILTAGTKAGAVAAASGSKTALTITSADVAKLFGVLPERYWPNARLYCSGYFFANGLARLGLAVGGNVETGVGLSYAGVPVTLTSAMPGNTDCTGAVMIVLADLGRGVALGSGRDLVAARSWQRYADLDQLALRITERFVVNVHGCGDGTNAGPIVGLVGTA